MKNISDLGGGLSTSHTSPFGDIFPSKMLGKYYEDHRAMLSKVDFAFLSLADGRLQPGASRYEFSPEEPKLVLRLGGSLAVVKTGLGGAVGGGGRGEVTGFSSSSRRRLMRLIASIERQERPVFVTLTYPDVFPPGQDVWKRDIDTFGKRVARRFPSAGFIWRIEFKVRLSGLSVGQLAPHFHLLVYNVHSASLLKMVSAAWWGVVGSGDDDHLRAGTRVERIFSLGGIMRYVGKYIAKEDDYPEGWTGRVWGVVGRKHLPWAVEVVISLTDLQSVNLVRLGRRMIGAAGRSFPHGLTWIVNAERVLDYLEYLCDFSPD